jgi:hypothetical protein
MHGAASSIAKGQGPYIAVGRMTVAPIHMIQRVGQLPVLTAIKTDQLAKQPSTHPRRGREREREKEKERESDRVRTMPSAFMAANTSAMISCGRLRERMPRCHLDRFLRCFSGNDTGKGSRTHTW